MQIKKRSLPLYIFLNCITLGIYGFIVNVSVGDEINEICKGDNEEPRFGYAATVMLRAIPAVVGIVVGLIVSLVATNSYAFELYSYFGGSELRAAVVFLCMAAFGVVFSAVGSVISGIYHKYWWFRQAGRLKLNAYRYDITVKESGTETFLFRTIAEVFLLPITIILVACSIAIPALIVWLITLAGSSGAMIFAAILTFVFSLPIMFFGMDLTAGANFSMLFIFKNLSRYADVYSAGAKPFEKMGYPYYPSDESLLFGIKNVETPVEKTPRTTLIKKGTIVGLKGSCAGYEVELTAGDEVIIGKDAKVAQIVIESAYKEISRKHCGVSYNENDDMFTVTDYSLNGTFIGDMRLPQEEPYTVAKGTVIRLANDKNTFRLE